MTLKVVAAGARKPGRVAGVEVSPPTREVILDTAERLFAARGVEGVALRDLAREMGFTAPSLYNHFPSKQALYEAVLDRGLRPIVELVAETWQQGALQPERMRATTDRLIAHLALHPHLGRLLQRAMLDENGPFDALLGRWLSPLYREGLAVVRENAGAAGWEPAEVPHLAIGLFGLMFSYFVNITALHNFAAWTDDPLSPHALAVQQGFLREALRRLLTPRRTGRGRDRKRG